MLHISKTSAPLAFQQIDIVDSVVIPPSLLLVPDDIAPSVHTGPGFVLLMKEPIPSRGLVIPLDPQRL
jgi:hypothetical protein